MNSINNDVESTLLSLEENLVETTLHVEKYQKNLLLEVIKERHTEKYIAQQRRIMALRTPLSTAISAFQRILGGEKKEQEVEIDTSVLEEDFEVTKRIFDQLDYRQSINFFNESMKHGLKRTNSIWIKKLDI
ncbi:hypothetical protein GF319_15030 [Candidatus Bathyarchaeota archaeon]|nr:hypothetical protein [Candidatus Bathyarchaeota archaeon]